MWLTAGGHWLVSLPLIALFSLGLGWGVMGVWAAMLIQMALRALLTVWRFRQRFHPQLVPV